MTNKITNLRSNQDGIVSIVVTVILMLIMTLIVLSMSHNANKEQRQAIDRQLSDQAYYNAESGINDIAYYLYKYPAMPNKVTECSGVNSFAEKLKAIPGAPDLTSGQVGAAAENKYTCALYNKTPPTLEFQKLGISESEVIPVNGVDTTGAAVDVKKLIISWDDADDPGGAISGSCSFSAGSPAELPPSCGYGGVRVQLINASNNREAISKLSFITYILPNASAATPISVAGNPPYPENQGIVGTGKCDNVSPSRRCVANIDDINLPNFFLQIRSLYRPVNLTITGQDAVGNAIYLKNAQVEIDVTGKSNDILRRIQVRAPIAPSYNFPPFAVQSKESVCKLISVIPNSASAVADSNGNTCPID